MAEGVVDLLETIDVDVQHRRARVRAACASEHALGSVQHERAIGQAGQRVVERQKAQLILCAFEITPRQELPRQHERGRERRADRETDPVCERVTELDVDQKADDHGRGEVRKPGRPASPVADGGATCGHSRWG